MEINAAQRNRYARLYESTINNDAFTKPTIPPDVEPKYLRYTILNKSKHPTTEISQNAWSQGFEIGSFNWQNPIHLKYPYNRIIKKTQDLKNSEYLSKNIINLPVHKYLSEDDINKITEFLNNIK